MNLFRTCTGLTTTLLVAMPLFAQQQTQPTRDLPAVAAGGSATATATVEAIDLATREVSLRKEDGELVTFRAGEEVRNLPQLKVGDRVVATYTIGAIVAASPADGSEPARVEDFEIKRAPEGALPGALARQTTAVTGTVVGVDSAERTLTVRGARQTVTLPVEDDVDLSKIKVGDRIDAIAEESLAITVERLEN